MRSSVCHVIASAVIASPKDSVSCSYSHPARGPIQMHVPLAPGFEGS